MADLAQMIRKESDSDSLVQAREDARQGVEAHPDSIGGQRCRYIIAQLEAPSYRLQAMASDGLKRRSLKVVHSNLDILYLRAYNVDIERLIQEGEDYYILPRNREVQQIISREQPDFAWSVELPDTPDLRSHTTYLVPPIDRFGAYLVVASTRADFDRNANRLTATTLIMSDVVLLTEPHEGGYEITVRSGGSGKPIQGAEVTLYRRDWRQGHHQLATETSASDGRLYFSRESLGDRGHFLLARYQGQVAIDLSPLRRPGMPSYSQQTAALIYTDRSVYRPGQTLFWKAVAYHGGGKESRFKTLAETPLTISLLDANGETVESTSVTTNRFGSVSGQISLPVGRLLGRWQVRASIGGATLVRVEEYKRPTFEVEVSDPEAPMRLNRPATFSGHVRYYFGLPVVNGSVSWQVTREPVFPRWWYWWRPQPHAERQIVAGGDTHLEEDGTFTVTFTPEADEREAQQEGMSYRYRLTADVTDEGGETRSGSRTFRLGFVAVEATIISDSGFFSEGQPVSLKVTRRDLNGVPRAGKGEWRLVSLVQPKQTLLPADQLLPAPQETDAYSTPGDRQRPRWQTRYEPQAVLAGWDEGQELASGRLEHGEDGPAIFDLGALKAGAYRIIYTTEDDFGATCRSRKDLLVAGRRSTPVALPGLLVAERSSVPVGEDARLLVRSGLADQEMVLEIFTGNGERQQRRVLRSGDAELIEIPVREQDRGGFSVSLRLLRDHQLIHLSETIFVPWDSKKLKVELATFRDRMRPGTRETFKVTVRGADDELIETGAAELLAYMYDRSLDIFAPHSPFNPIALYQRYSPFLPLRCNLGLAATAANWGTGLSSVPRYPSLRGDRLKFLDGYGIGGMGRRQLKAKAIPAAAMSLRESATVAEAEPSFADEIVVTSDQVQVQESREMDAIEEIQPEPVELRSDFSETAFWEPHLLLEPDGSVSVSFDVPDSVTEWSLWVHALTTDLRSGSLSRQTRTVKELMVRPYLPRFLREGDHAELKVVVNNAGESELSGILDLEILDADSDQDIAQEFGLAPAASRAPFTVAPGGGANLSFPVKVPARIGTIAFRVTARADQLSDGELRPVPVLPGRMHLVQSRFVTLQDRDRRELHFADMAAVDDPSMIHDQLLVTVDAQLFYSVLNALPYLVSYPYECTEQTLNRFLSTGIVTSLYDSYPAVARMAKQLSARETRLEAWNQADPNRNMALEETPWLMQARGGTEKADELINVLDPRIARAERDQALAKLEKAQTSIGAFPWWPGGPPSPYMTLYILYGLSKGLEYDLQVPRPMVVKAWAYMHRHYLDRMVGEMMQHDCCWETITFLSFVLSCYPDVSWTGDVFTEDERQQMLSFSFRHWREHSPLLKGYLTLTLLRAGRSDDARLVFDSVMDSARTTQDEGTFWAPEDRAWLWYNDTIESHAFAMRVLSELEPADARRHGLVHWLLLNKKLNHWKSTRATAEVIYALVRYLEQEGALAIREEIAVDVGPERTVFVFEPDRYTGRNNQVLIPGDEIDPETMSTVIVEKESKGFAFASATWHFSTEKLPDEARGDLFSVTRRYFKRVNDGREWLLQPLAEGASLAPGDQVEVQLSVRARHAAEYVHLRDPRGAGFEPESTTSRYRWDLGIGWYEEIRDSGTNFFFEWLPAGEYTLKYRLRANMAGAFRVGPAVLQSMYAPEYAAYSSGSRLQIGDESGSSAR
jgi:uncharacterized protein YfaS (alpha-2-macroglobulin family)